MGLKGISNMGRCQGGFLQVINNIQIKKANIMKAPDNGASFTVKRSKLHQRGGEGLERVYACPP